MLINIKNILLFAVYKKSVIQRNYKSSTFVFDKERMISDVFVVKCL